MLSSKRTSKRRNRRDGCRQSAVTCSSRVIGRRRRRRQQQAISSLLAVCISCTDLPFTEAFSSSVPTTRKETRTSLYATIENETRATDLSFRESSEFRESTEFMVQHGLHQHNGREIKNGHSLEPRIANELEEEDWPPEIQMNDYFGSLEDIQKLATATASNEVEPFYAERSTTIAVTSNGEVKEHHVPSNEMYGVSEQPSPPSIVDWDGQVDAGDSLLGIRSLSTHETKHAAQADVLVASATSSKGPSRARRALRATRNALGHASPLQIFADLMEEEHLALNSFDPTALENVASAEELKAEKQQKKEAATLARMSRLKKKRLTSLLKKVNLHQTKRMAGMTSRTLTALVAALAEEADGMSVRIDAKEESPIWRKQIDTVAIEFTRLGFKPLYMGSHDQLVPHDDEQKNQKRILKRPSVETKQVLKRETLPQPSQASDDEDSCPVEYTLNDEGVPIGAISCADTAFQQIDVDNSGALDKDEIADALVLAASSSSQRGSRTLAEAAAEVGEGGRKAIQQLARQLVDLYDTNSDGVIDRMEYQEMVEDMAALRQVQKEREQKEQEDKNNGENLFGNLWNAVRGSNQDEGTEIEEGVDQLSIANATEGNEIGAIAETALPNQVPETTGKIILENVKVDLRQAVFGAIPIVKHVSVSYSSELQTRWNYLGLWSY